MRNNRIHIFNILCLSIFLVFAGAVWMDGRCFAWDIILAHMIQSIQFPGFHGLMRVLSLPGNHAWVESLLVTTLFGILFWFGCRVEASCLMLSAGGGYALNLLLKWEIARPRPTAAFVNVMVHEMSSSFPSGHVMHYVTFYGFLVFLTYKLLSPAILGLTVKVRNKGYRKKSFCAWVSKE